MTGITIIIVSYKVKYFLRQCLQSIQASQIDVPVEVIIVDNDSDDGSIQMLKTEFPEYKLIDNQVNVGFGKANNQAIKVAAGMYTLILNPDTILQENTLQVCYEHMQTDIGVGALGVKMVDGTGRFLPESKRGFPTPMKAFFKVVGLNKLFPRSAFFNGYYAGHLSETKVSEVDVLTGAFLFARTDILKKIGGFDEDYFMYGEDIELSYQIKAHGHKIHYLPDEKIIHFKGESTNKLSLDYIKRFYGAMGIYASKRNSGAGIWKLFIYLGIAFTAIKGWLEGLLKKLTVPLIDIGFIFLAFIGIKYLWSIFYMRDVDYYTGHGFEWLVLLVIVVAVFIYGIFGQYDKRHNLKHLFFGFFISTSGILSLYSLLPEAYRFSRFIILLLCLSVPFILAITRMLSNKLFSGKFTFDSVSSRRVAIVSNESSFEKLSKLVKNYSGPQSLIGRIAIIKDSSSLGQVEDIESICDSRSINELIFSSKDLVVSRIFELMSRLESNVSFKIADNDSSSILGSDSKERIGEWYTYEIGHKISQPFHQRIKRLMDVGFSLLTILILPLTLISPNRGALLGNFLSTIIGSKTWQGYDQADDAIIALPRISPSVFTAFNNSDNVHEENLYYARNFSSWSELASLMNLLIKKRRTN